MVLCPQNLASAKILNKTDICLSALDGRTAVFLSFTGLVDDKEHIAIGLGDFKNVDIPLVRLHSECLTGDVFGSERCDCGPQLNEAIRRIDSEGGFILYLRHEGRGIGLCNKLSAYNLQSNGFDTYDANRQLGFEDDLRDYSSAAQMLFALGKRKIRLLSNNPEKKKQLCKLVHCPSLIFTWTVHQEALK